jgi:hypothetical protein
MLDKYYLRKDYFQHRYDFRFRYRYRACTQTQSTSKTHRVVGNPKIFRIHILKCKNRCQIKVTLKRSILLDFILHKFERLYQNWRPFFVSQAIHSPFGCYTTNPNTLRLVNQGISMNSMYGITDNVPLG